MEDDTSRRKRLDLETIKKVIRKPDFNHEGMYVEEVIVDTDLYNKVENLTRKIYSKRQFKSDIRWEGLYVPVNSRGKEICIPLFIMKLKNNYFLHVDKVGSIIISTKEFATRENLPNLGSAVIIDSNETKEYRVTKNLVLSLDGFLPELNKPKAIEKRVPYEYRGGKIKRKYVVSHRDLMGELTKKQIFRSYRRHLRKVRSVDRISLNEYLHTAAIAYRALYPEFRDKNSLEMYDSRADFRHGGMLDIKDANSKDEYTNWLVSSTWSGSHPFEIIAGYRTIGICLDPPRKNKYLPQEESGYYTLSAGGASYHKTLVDILSAFIKRKAPVRAAGLKEILNYLTGKTFLRIDEFWSDETVPYSTLKQRRLLSKVVWDRLSFAKLRHRKR